MGYFFEDQNSMYAQAGCTIARTLEAVARRYVGVNPPHPPTYRAYCKRGIHRAKDYRYEVDFDRIFPNAVAEQYVYAWARYWSDNGAELKFDVTCFGPMAVYCNGASVFRSGIVQERYRDTRHSVAIQLAAGWNHFVIRFKKTRAGFGGRFGTWLGKLPYYFLMPTEERGGQEGWIYTPPMSRELETLPGAGLSEKATGLKWLPEETWEAAELKKGQLARIFGPTRAAVAVGWTTGSFLHEGPGGYRLQGHHRGSISVWIADREVFRAAGSGKIAAAIEAPFGCHPVMVKCACEGDDWGFEIALHHGNEAVPLQSPCRIQGASQPWIYLGPLGGDVPIDWPVLRDLNRTTPGLTGETYWRLDVPETWVRPYNENPLWGRWNYPLGVTLYGLLHSARAIGSAELQQYVVGHVQFCCDLFRYALWDKEQFGGATAIHHLLTSIDSLDDCGSFGSVLLEVARHFEIRGYREIADFVADYISNRQVRLPDGTFFRKHLMHVFHEDTMWADDLYMSVPFLCRYYQLAGDRRYLDDAARQFLGFKRHLYIPELQVMSHVYDFKRQMATGVPWGRGNGWVIFSLSELLAVLPTDHELRPALLEMFRVLCAGYLSLQDEKGMWHQVLNLPESYPESSCTSMFIYAFARGVRLGWLDQPDPYIRAVFRAWEALNRISIDKGGNVYGVCRGSEFSFSPEYYQKELSWNLNDTHGIGIVLLAGVEVLNLQTHLQQ